MANLVGVLSLGQFWSLCSFTVSILKENGLSDVFYGNVDGPFYLCGSFNSFGSFFSIYIHSDCRNRGKMSGWYLKQDGIPFLSYTRARGDDLAKV